MPSPCLLLCASYGCVSLDFLAAYHSACGLCCVEETTTSKVYCDGVLPIAVLSDNAIVTSTWTKRGVTTKTLTTKGERCNHQNIHDCKKKKKKKKKKERERERERYYLPIYLSIYISLYTHTHTHIHTHTHTHPRTHPPPHRPPRWPSGKAAALRAEDPGFESRLRRDFFGVESYQ